MSTQIIPFDTQTLPAFLNRKGDRTNDLVGNSASGGFPVISIKGKVFHIQRSDERTLITKPGEDDPAASIEVVVLAANPNKSKVFYAEGYQEGEKAKPTCYSNSGIAPETDAQEPQAKKCAVCVHNQWGSRMTSDGRKAKACADSRRLAIATVDTPSDPMLLRVPAASMRSLEDYGKILAARGVKPRAVVTKIGFDYSVAHPALTFKPVGFVADAEALAEIDEVADGDLVAQITGNKVGVSSPETEVPEPTPAPAIQAPAPAPVQPPKAAAPAAPKPATPKPSALDAAVATAATTKKVTVAVEEKKAVPAGVESLASEIDSLMDGMDFDD